MFRVLLEAIANELHRASIPYMVIGGQAVLLHGEPRATKDIDVTLGVDAGSLPRVIDVVHRLELSILVEDATSFVAETMVLPTVHSPSGIRVDFIFSTSAFEQRAIARAIPVCLGAAVVNYCSLEDLIVHKVIAGRQRDLEDVRTLLLKHPDCDIGYVESWLARFGAELEKPYAKTFSGILSEASRHVEPNRGSTTPRGDGPSLPTCRAQE